MKKRITAPTGKSGWKPGKLLVLCVTLFLSLSLYHGWLSPLLSDSATNTYYFTLDSTGQDLGADGHTDTTAFRNCMISMRTGVYDHEQRVTAAATTNWQPLITSYSPAYAKAQVLTVPVVTIGVRDSHGTSNLIYWKAEVYDYDPAGTYGNGVLLWASTGTNEAHPYSTAPLSLTFADSSARNIPASHRLKVKISCRMTSTNSEARLYWGNSATYSSMKVTETEVVPNAATVTNLADYNSGALRSVLTGEGHVAMLRFDLYANAAANWTGGKLDKIGSNPNLADATFSIYKDSNSNGLFDVATDQAIGGPYSFSQATGSAYSLTTPQVLGAAPQRYFVTYSIAPNAALQTTVGARIADNSYFTVSNGLTVTGVNSTSSSLPTINALGTAVSKTYAADWDSGTLLVRPETGGPTVTNSNCVITSITEPRGTNLVGLLNYPAHTCTSISGRYHFSSEANPKFVSLYFNGPTGYPTKQSEIKGVSFKFRARCSVYGGGTFTLTLFYVKPDGTRVNSPVSSKYTTSSYGTVTVSLAGQNFKDVPAGSRLGMQIGVSRSSCGVGLGSAVDAKLIVAESAEISSGVEIGDGMIVIGGNVLAGATGNVVDSFTMSAPMGVQTFTSVSVTGGPTTTSTNVAAVKLYADLGTLGELDPMDTLLGTGSFVGNTAIISGLTETVNGTLRRYLVVYDIAADPQTNVALSGVVTAIGGSVTIDSNWDISSATLNIVPTTTVTNGYGEPLSKTVPSVGNPVNIDAFGVRINGGSDDTIQTVTASLLPVGVSKKLAKVEIVNRASGAVYGELTAPTSGEEWRINTTGLLAKTSPTECYVRITPKTTITTVIPVSALVTAITHSKGKYGLVIEDTSSATITIDGEKPTEPLLTAVSGSVSGQIQLSWTAATDSSGLKASGAYTVVRGIANAPAPATCTSGVPVYQGNSLAVSENGLAPGQHYAYRVCAADSVGNVTKGTTANALSTIPTDCDNPPSVIAMPSSQHIKTGAQAEYQISVTNNDTGSCSPATFNLTLAGVENSAAFITPSLLGTTSFTLAPNGGGATTTLRVTARPAAPQGSSNSVSVSVSAAGHPSVATTTPITTTINDNSGMMHSSLNLGQLKYGAWGTDYTCTTCHVRGLTPNIKLVKDKIVTPTGLRPVLFDVVSSVATDLTGVMGNDLRGGTTSTNVCEVCHHNTRAHQYSSAKVAWKEHHNGRNCMICHPHDIGFKYAGGGRCNDCHGNPPTSFSTMAFPQTNALGSFSPNAGAHEQHAAHMKCATCHSNGNHFSSDSARDNHLIEMGFIITGDNFPGFANSVTSGTLFTGTDILSNGYLWSTAPGTTLLKVPNTTTCSVYCHGWPGSGGTNSNPSWVGVSQKSCGTCHDASGESPPASGSHRKHAGSDAESDGIPCKTCHGGFANYSTSPAHITGQVEWNLAAISPIATYKGTNSGTTGTLAPANPTGYGVCTNLYCHSNVQTANGNAGPSYYAAPRWGESVGCGGCHDDMALSANPTGGHLQHAKDPITQFDCRICHGNGGDANAYNHGNKRVDFQFGGLAANTRYSRGSAVVPGSGSYGSCSASNCHGRAVIGWVGENPAIPVCDKCHGSYTTIAFYDTRGPGSPTGKTEPYVGSHDIHIKAAPYSYAKPLKCSECHIEPGGPYTPQHIDSALPAEVGFEEIASAGIFYGYTSKPQYDFTSRSCSNLWCHGAGMNSNTGKGVYGSCQEDGGSLGTAGTPRWNDVLLNGTTADCTPCHSYPPCAPGPGYVHYGLTPNQCKDCHNNLNADGRTFNDPTLHVNGVVDGCFTCHGRPPLDEAGLVKPALKALPPGNSGGHTAHTLNPGINGFCNSCHNNYSPEMPGYTLQIGFNAYNGKVVSGTFYGYSTIVNNRFVSSSPGTTVRRTTDPVLLNRCLNVYCHGAGSAAREGVPGRDPLQGGTNTDPTWNLGYGEVSCGTCHGVTGATYTTGSHVRHAGSGTGGLAIDCGRCHGVKENNYHVNGRVEWHLDTTDPRFGQTARYKNISSGDTGDLAPSFTFGSCSNVYCHSNVQGAGGEGQPTSYGTPQWGGPSLACSACHKNMAVDPAASGSHPKHANVYACGTCHNGAGSSSPQHADHTIDVVFDSSLAGTTYSAGSHPAGSGAYGTCGTITCHGGLSAVWGGTLPYPIPCLGCHAAPIGSRAGIASQFSANSHHIQGIAVTNAHCYQCHWEANSDGSINATYHQKSANAAIDLVVRTSAARPTAYTVGSTALQYVANGSRTEMAKINSHCLGCHNDAGNAAIPFGDGKTPNHYAWDAPTKSSIGARYGDSGTTAWGKYNSTTYKKVTPKDKRTKAYSAHGNATANQGGWDLNETWPNTRAGSTNILCFDCHNSHGSNVAGTTTSYASATANGGILKDTAAGQGGYSVTYKPSAGGSAAGYNQYNAGAALCFDCHLSTSLTTYPWSYSATFGATQTVMGYFDTLRFGNSSSGSARRDPYKASRGGTMGGHFGASAGLSVPAAHPVGGLCTPCHDPHGLSPMLANKAYGVPLLKGTYLTSPFLEDRATPDNIAYRYLRTPGQDDAPNLPPGVSMATYSTARNAKRINENTFGGTGAITETDTLFAGLCLKCHPKTALTNGTNHTWKTKDRIHESVKGWKTANANDKHKFSCSKCHSAHTSVLPRLMVTNCMDSNHRGRVASTTGAVSASGSGSEGNGSGRIPGYYTSTGSSLTPKSYNMSCHEGNTGSGTNQLWNNVTPF